MYVLVVLVATKRAVLAVFLRSRPCSDSLSAGSVSLSPFHLQFHLRFISVSSPFHHHPDLQSTLLCSEISMWLCVALILVRSGMMSHTIQQNNCALGKTDCFFFLLGWMA
jgi:hypothetical protein